MHPGHALPCLSLIHIYVEKIKELADAIHARGGKVVGTCVVCNPWLLDKLEPYCDALTMVRLSLPVGAKSPLMTST